MKKYHVEGYFEGEIEADWWSEKWAQRRADWMNWKEENRNDKDVRRIHKKQRD